MTKEEIIDMARQTGFVNYELDDGTTDAFDKRYEAFAMLVAKHERKDIWEMVKKYGDGLPSNDIKVTCMYLCHEISERNFK
jgi:hypothetical protein